jgi:undecaprenyl-diphosphatase
MYLDETLFRFINRDLSNPLFDKLMPFVSTLNEGLTGIAALLLLISYIAYRFRKKSGWVLLGLVLSVGVSDLFAYRVVKPALQRPRPSFTLEDVQLRVERHSGYSFPSNHAANSFAGATLLSLIAPGIAPFFMTFAFIVSLSRVYVGVHYPFDILAGAMIGALFGWLAYLLLRGKITTSPEAP